VRDLEHVTERVAHHCPPIAIGSVERLFQAHRSGSKRPPIRAVCVVDIDVQKRWEQVALASWRHHDKRVANTDFGWAARVKVAQRVEHRA